MSDPYKNLEEQLGAAVRRRAVAAAAPRRFARWPRGAVPALAIAAVLGTGAATAAVVLGPDDQPANQVKQALFAGEQATKAAPACRPVRIGAPRLVDDPAPAWLVARLGVLRRPATARDRIPRGALLLGGQEVLRRSIRVARASDGWSYRFFLSRGVIAIGRGQRDPVACVRVRRDAAVAAAAGFSADVRAQVAAIVDPQVRSIEEQASGRRLAFSLTELRPDGRPSGGGGGYLRGERFPATGSVGTFRRGNRRFVALSGLVPDGVARVRVVDGAGAPRERPVSVAVRDDVFHVLLPRRMGPRMTVEWRAASGRVLRRTHPRS